MSGYQGYAAVTSQPIVTQPGVPVAYQPATAPVPNCLPGLEALAYLDSIRICQRIDILELVTNYECANTYDLNNAQGMTLYNAIEESNFCSRIFCRNRRSYTMHVVNQNQEVLRIERPYKWCTDFNCCCWGENCCPSFKHQTFVYHSDGPLLGRVLEEIACCARVFRLYNEVGEFVLRVKGPPIGCCEAHFEVTTKDGTNIGSIEKEWSGTCQELYTQADNFTLTFPLDLDAKMKAVLIGATFLIDFILYEKSRKRRRDDTTTSND